MSDLQPTYSFEDGVITASVGEKVIASGTDLEAVEREVGEALAAPKEKTAGVRTATHVVSPNGLKGKILTRTAGVWGDSVTVRFDNGQMYQVPVTDRTQFITENQKVASSSPIQRLSSVIAETVGPDVDSLTTRTKELKTVVVEARDHLIKGASVVDEGQLNEIILQAQHELREIGDAIEYINTTAGQGYQPPSPAYEMHVVDQATVGYKEATSWLDATVDSINKEAADTDFEKLLDDGPTLLVSSFDDDSLADAGDVRDRAIVHVRAKTAGITSDAIEQFENLFVARVEEARRVELAHRKQNTKKEAAQKQSNIDDAPVESLFL